MSTQPPDIKTRLKAEAARLGFADVRVGPVVDSTEKLMPWLAQGYHGTMGWMAREPEKRANPKALWPEVQSIVAVGMNYGPDTDPLELLKHPDLGNISVYARGKDYHTVVKKKLRQLASWLADNGPAQVKMFVDTAPVMEKPLAQAAGLGWQGKHTNLVSRTFGSWLFLGIIYTDIALAPDAPEPDHCGSCRKCLDACPTDAFIGPYRLDARKCISYLTIEHEGPVDEALRPRLGNRIVGCDDCLAACPWNKYAQTAKDIKLYARDHMVGPTLEQLAALDAAGFETFFAGTPAKRLGRDRLVRNVLYAMGNSKDAGFIKICEGLLTDPVPMVADAARWALKQLKA